MHIALATRALWNRLALLQDLHRSPISSQRLSKPGHLAVTWCVAIASNFSALWILIANAWMQNPIGSRFNPDTMRMEVTDFMAVIFNPVAQAKFVHTVSAGYVTGSVFVLAISALTARASAAADLDPDSISFAQALRLIRRTATGTAAIPPCGLG